MNYMENFLSKAYLILVGVIGVGVGLTYKIYFRGEKVDRRKGIAYMVIGSTFTYFTTPAIANKFDLATDLLSLVGFLVGMLGIFVVGGFIQLGESFVKDPSGTFKSLRGSFDIFSFMTRPRNRPKN